MRLVPALVALGLGWLAADAAFAQARETLTDVIWLERPSAEDIARNYPPEAWAAGYEGRVTLDCIVISTGRLSCRVARERPEGYGFGAAALRLSQRFRMGSTTPEGRPTQGRRVGVSLDFSFD